MTDLITIVPTRSRPEAVARVVRAWTETGAFDDGAEVSFVIDVDDPRYGDYMDALAEVARPGVRRLSLPTWRPLVPKLNEAATLYAEHYREVFALGFAGDDHLPRTRGWARRYIDILRVPGAGVVSSPDGYRPDDLPTQWAMRADVVRALGEMVPAPVEHLYCDDVIRDVAAGAGCYDYLLDLLIEHMHPVAGKANRDDQYDRVNSRRQYRGDRAAYRHWRDGGGLADAVARVRALTQKGGTG